VATNPTINGTKLPIEQQTDISYDPQRGTSIRTRYESAGDNLVATAEALAAGQIAYELTRSKFKSSLIASQTDNATGDSWEIQANEIQKDVYEHWRCLAIEENWPGTLMRIRRDIEYLARGEAVGSPAPEAAAMAAGGTALMSLLTRGTTHYSISQYVLKHTTSVANTYDVNISDVNVECIYTTSQLLYECTLRRSWVFPLPRRLVFKIQRLPAPVARAGYLWGWRKLPSTESNAARNRINITTEYWLEQWSTFLYDPAV